MQCVAFRLINDCVTANDNVSRPPFWSAILEFIIGCVSTFYNWCALSLRIIQWKNEILYINKWLSYCQLSCFTAAILSAILEFVIRFVSNFYNWCLVSLSKIQWKNEVSILINGWVIANYSVSRPPFCPPSWNLESYLCKTLTAYVRCHSAQLKNNGVSISNRFPGVHKRGIHTHTDRHTHTHTHMTIA